MKRSTSLWAPILAAVILTQPGIANAVPNTFMAGDPIDADEMNANFTDLEQRLAPIEDEDNQIVAIDCDADVNALATATIRDRTTYVLTGMCNGPIEIYRKRNVIIEGDANGVKDDGVFLPPGLLDNPFAAIGIYESNAELRNLKVDASNYVTNNYAWNSSVNTVGVQVAVVRLYDTDIVGGDRGLSVYRTGWVKVYDDGNGSSVKDFNIEGVSSSAVSHVELNAYIEVTSTLTSTEQYPAALASYNNSTIDVRNGGIFTSPNIFDPDPNDSNGYYNYAIDAGFGATVHVRASTNTSEFNGHVEAYDSGIIRMLGNATIHGYLGAYGGSNIEVRDTDQDSGVITASRNSSLRIRNGSSISGDISASSSSHISIFDSVHSGSVINATDSSSVRINNSTFAGRISPRMSSTVNISNSTQVGNDDISASENSSVLLDNTPIVADSIYISDSSTLTLRNGSDHSGGDITATESSTIRLQDIDFAGNISSNNGSSISIVRSNQIGSFSIGANTKSSILIQDTSDVSFLTSNTGSTVVFEGAFQETLGTANAYTGATLVINQSTVAGQIDASTNSTISLSEVTQTANGIFLNVGAIADISNSSIGFTETINGTVLQINDGTVAGVRIGHGSAASIYGASVTSDIGVGGPSSNLHITVGGGSGTLNLNTLFLCGNTTSFIDAGITTSGTIDNNGCLP